ALGRGRGCVRARRRAPRPLGRRPLDGRPVRARPARGRAEPPLDGAGDPPRSRDRVRDRRGPARPARRDGGDRRERRRHPARAAPRGRGRGRVRRRDPPLRRAVRTTVAACVPLAVVLSATAVAIVPLLFGHAYEGAAVVLAILAWKIPMTAFGLPYGAVLVAREKQVALMQNNLVAAGLTVVADLAVIPLLGIRGAAVVGVGSAIL